MEKVTVKDQSKELLEQINSLKEDEIPQQALQQKRKTFVFLDGPNIFVAGKRMLEIDKINYRKFKKLIVEEISSVKDVVLKFYGQNPRLLPKTLVDSMSPQERKDLIQRTDRFHQILRDSGFNVDMPQPEDPDYDVDHLIQRDIKELLDEKKNDVYKIADQDLDSCLIGSFLKGYPMIADIILVAGDGHYADVLVEEIRKRDIKIKIIVIATRENISHRLLNLADEIIYLEDIQDKIELIERT